MNKTLIRATSVLRLLAQHHEGLTITETSKELGAAKITVFDIEHTLENEKPGIPDGADRHRGLCIPQTRWHLRGSHWLLERLTNSECRKSPRKPKQSDSRGLFLIFQICDLTHIRQP